MLPRATAGSTIPETSCGRRLPRRSIRKAVVPVLVDDATLPDRRASQSISASWTAAERLRYAEFEQDFVI
jgi:hypothetical protein